MRMRFIEKVRGATLARPERKRPSDLAVLTGALGQDQEAFRIKCDMTASDFQSVSENIRDIFGAAAQMSKDMQAKIIEFEDLSLQHKTLRQNAATLSSELDEAQRDRLQLGQRVASLEVLKKDHEQQLERLLARELELDTSLRIKSGDLVALAAELEDAKQQIAALSREAEAQDDRLEKAKLAFEKADSERHALGDKIAAEASEKAALSKLKEELQQKYIAASQQIAELSARGEELKSEIAKLTGERDRALQELGEVRSALLESETRRQLESVTHETMMEASRSRIDLTEKLLQEARNEARGLQGAHNAAHDAERRVAELKDILAKTILERDDKAQRAHKATEENKLLLTKIEDLTRSLKEASYKADQARTDAESTQVQLDQARLDKQTALDRAKAREQSLLDVINKEKMERAYAEGALEIARKDRLQLQRVVESMRHKTQNDAPQHSSADAGQADYEIPPKVAQM